MSRVERTGAVSRLAESARVRGAAPMAASAAPWLRLLFAVDSRFPTVGGAEAQAFKLALALRERGVHVEFVAPRVERDQSLHEVFHGFEIHRIGYPYLPWLGSLVLMVKFGRWLVRHRERFDVVHVHITHLLAASAGFARAHGGLPVLTKVSGYFEFEGGVLDRSRRFRPPNLLLRAGLARVDAIQAISEQTREKLLAAGVDVRRILSVPNGIDTRVPPVAPPADGVLRIGYCGRLREVKGVQVLLEGFARLVAARPEARARLVIAGDGTYGDVLRARAQELALEESIDWLGMIDDTAPLFERIDIYVQPSFAEGLPNSVMEAMLAARPVVASDIGGNRDLVVDGGNGLLFPAGDADALFERLASLASDAPLRARLGAAGRVTIEERYGMDRVVGQLVEAYRARAAT